MTTSIDVARLAGVSQMTVSRALRNEPHVSVATRDRVRAAADALGYVPDGVARAMRTGRTDLVGVVAGRITNPFYPQLIDALAHALALRGLGVVLWPLLDGQSEAAAIEAIHGTTVDGLIFTTATEDSASLAEAAARHFPIVMINRSILSVNADEITTDNELGGAEVAEYFISHGHQRIAVIQGEAGISTGEMRKRGFLERARELGAPAPDVLCCPFTHAGGLGAGMELLGRSNRPAAVLCGNDAIAFGVLDAAHQLCVRVPDDLWVVGFDDVEMAAWPSFDLTTIKQPAGEMANAAVDLLVRRIEDPATRLRKLRFRGQLIIRGSTGHVESGKGRAPSGVAR